MFSNLILILAIRLGASYPQALGHNDGNDEAMPVEGRVFVPLSLL
jgi:hypothetical protein